MESPEPVAVVLYLKDNAATASVAVQMWRTFLATLDRPTQLIVVDGGGNGEIEGLKADGLGAAIRAALAATDAPLLLATTADYPYTPGDLRTLLARIDTASEIPDPATGELVMRKPDIVCGARTGIAPPGWIAALGKAYRLFCRIALGLPLSKPPGWYGLRERAFSWWVWLVYGVPLEDPNCKFKLFRTAYLRSVPIQSNGDFVQVELLAKATLLTRLLDEVPLSPQTAALPRAHWAFADRRLVFSKPKFVQQPA